MSKRCTKCGEVKDLEAFHRRSDTRDGRKSRCKTCMNAGSIEWRRANPDKAREAVRRYRGDNPEADLRHLERYNERYPEKYRARREVAKAVHVTGELVKPSACEECGAHVDRATDMHAHHKDYSKPLSVKWICRTCHLNHHKDAATPVDDEQARREGFEDAKDRDRAKLPFFLEREAEIRAQTA